MLTYLLSFSRKYQYQIESENQPYFMRDILLYFQRNNYFSQMLNFPGSSYNLLSIF